ncbi:MAG: flagellar basal body P-ring formation chaperone FlgA [Pseudomonadota bacterium]
MTRPGVLPTALSAAALVLAATGARAATAQAPAALGGHPHGEIIAVAEMAALDAAMAEGLDDVEVRVRPLDQRLKPARCDQALEIVRPNNGNVLGPVSYGVRCGGSSPWTLYLRASVSASLEIPVLRRGLTRGDLISERDIELVTRRITARAADIILEPELLLGMEVRRPIPAGSPLRHGQVDYPVLVTRGQTVTLVAGGAGLEVRMQGKAMGSGAMGDRLVVTNLNSGRRVEGIVQRDGSIQIR